MTIHVIPIPSTIELTTPAFVLGDSNVAGDSTGAVAANSTLGVIATQAEMEAATSTVKSASPGRTQYHPGVAKAWVSVDKDGVIRSPDYNVDSITDVGTGIRVIVVGTDFSSVVYTAQGASTDISTYAPLVVNWSLFAVGSVQFTTYRLSNGTAPDSPTSQALFGDQ